MERSGFVDKWYRNKCVRRLGRGGREGGGEEEWGMRGRRGLGDEREERSVGEEEEGEEEEEEDEETRRRRMRRTAEECLCLWISGER